jgi:hypothetical protein
VSRVRVAVAGLLALLGLAYVGSYIVLLSPMPSPWEGEPNDAAYRAGGNAAETVFVPLEWIDRRVRPGYWADPPKNFVPLHSDPIPPGLRSPHFPAPSG